MIHDLKFAVHQLLTNPGFTAVAVFTLAPGICAEPFDVGFEIGGCERGLVPDAQPGGNGVKAL